MCVRAHTQAGTLCTHMRAHASTYPFSPKPGLESQGNRTPDLSQVLEARISGFCSHLLSSLGQSPVRVAGLWGFEAGTLGRGGGVNDLSRRY